MDMGIVPTMDRICNHNFDTIDFYNYQSPLKPNSKNYSHEGRILRSKENASTKE